MPSEDGSYFRINLKRTNGTPRQNLEAKIGRLITGLKEPLKMSKSCKFWGELVFARSTGFLVHQDRFLAIVGHCVFQGAQGGGFESKTGFGNWNFVFGLSQDQASGRTPAANVFGTGR